MSSQKIYPYPYSLSEIKRQTYWTTFQHLNDFYLFVETFKTEQISLGSLYIYINLDNEGAYQWSGYEPQAKEFKGLKFKGHELSPGRGLNHVYQDTHRISKEGQMLISFKISKK